MCAGIGSGGRFRKVPESSGVCWWFRRVPVCAGVGSGGRSGRFRRVPVRAIVGSGVSLVCATVGSGGRFRRVPVVRWCRYWRQGSEGSGELRCGSLLCNLVRDSHVIVLNTFW